MPRYITIIGLVASIAGAIGPIVTTLHPGVGKVIMLVGVAAAAVGRSLLPTAGQKPAQ